MSAYSRLSMALPVLLSLQGCGTNAADEADPAPPPAESAPSLAQELSYAAAAEPVAIDAPASEARRAEPVPARAKEAAAPRPRPAPPVAAVPPPAPPPAIAASAPEAPATTGAIAELPLPSSAVWASPDLSAVAGLDGTAEAVRTLPLPAELPVPISPAFPTVPRIMTMLPVAEITAGAEAPACDCLDLTCPIPVEACQFMALPDPNDPAGLLDPLAEAG